jgi:hypothetical protein
VGDLSLARRARRLAGDRDIDVTKLSVREYLKLLGIELPESTVEYLDRAGYVDEDGVIVLESVDPTLLNASGYLERFAGEEFFDEELEKSIHSYLFEGRDAGRYAVHVCQPGMICQFGVHGAERAGDKVYFDDGYFEFAIWDTKKDKMIFRGAVFGRGYYTTRNGKTYTYFEATSMVLKPVA